MMLIKRLCQTVALVALAISTQACAESKQTTGVEQERKAEARELLEELITFRTVKGFGQVPAMVNVLEERLKTAGFSNEDIIKVPLTIDGEEVEGLIVRYSGEENSDKSAIAFLAHMDVVDALPENWDTDPYTPVEKDGYLYGRGSQDNKFGVALLVTTFANLKEEGFKPNRDLYLAFSGDEETGMLTTREILKTPEIKSVEFALNSDAGGGTITKDGKPVSFTMQAAEKTFATYIITAKSAGGHSSAPGLDNAIYDLAHALTKIESHEFPVEFNEITRAMAKSVAAREGGELAEALNTLMSDPANREAIEVIKAYPQYSHMLWTTCVATMLRAGNAENALPQSANATVNCRIMPGTSAEEVRGVLIDTMKNDELVVTLQRGSVESPASPIREDIMGALQRAVAVNYPGVKLQPVMSSGGTEGREYRSVGIPTYGAGSLGLVRPEDSRAHGINERIRLDSYDKELTYWDTLIRDLAQGTD
ncbi:M20/M25/M40 family metallo-hydrolase [Hyphococcus lacteus]|uniref:M20/M25/M40 family metallo-hydrolase n=1 Tax=Hyphococcus lacteus TaxID=3143536 RepID=A0ABV3Z196_9PROT